MTESAIEHTLWITERVNSFLGLSTNPPFIPDHVIESIFVCFLLVIPALLIRNKLRMVPSGLQNAVEALFEYLLNLLITVIGPKGPRYFPLIATLSLFILGGNLIGLFPFCKSPTNNINVTLACTVIVFIYYHYHGVKEQGLKQYLKHFMGPMPQLAFFIFPLEIISHFARVMSLSIRLFGNIMGEDIIIIILLTLVPYIVPIPMMMFAIFTSLLQTFIFIMLSMMYIAGAVADEAH